MLLAFTAGFLLLMYIFVHPFVRGAAPKDFLYVLPFFGFILVWYAIGLRFTLWRAFGVELIVIENGLLHWTRTALFWTRKLDIPAREITDVANQTAGTSVMIFRLRLTGHLLMHRRSSSASWDR
jgi:hypothetical protein